MASGFRSHALFVKFGIPSGPRDKSESASMCFSHSWSLLSRFLDDLSQSCEAANGVVMIQPGPRLTPHRTAP